MRSTTDCPAPRIFITIIAHTSLAMSCRTVQWAPAQSAIWLSDGGYFKPQAQLNHVRKSGYLSPQIRLKVCRKVFRQPNVSRGGMASMWGLFQVQRFDIGNSRESHVGRTTGCFTPVPRRWSKSHWSCRRSWKRFRSSASARSKVSTSLSGPRGCPTSRRRRRSRCWLGSTRLM